MTPAPHGWLVRLLTGGELPRGRWDMTVHRGQCDSPAADSADPIQPACMCECVRAYICACMCLCLCVLLRAYVAAHVQALHSMVCLPTFRRPRQQLPVMQPHVSLVFVHVHVCMQCMHCACAGCAIAVPANCPQPLCVYLRTMLQGVRACARSRALLCVCVCVQSHMPVYLCACLRCRRVCRCCT